MIPIARPIIGEDESRAVQEVMASGQLAAGPKVTEFETKFAEFCKVAEAVACCSGTAGLCAAVSALELERGAKVLTTPFSFIATANCILQAGLSPVFVDVDAKTGSIAADAVEEALRTDPSIRAILPVHLYGQPCEIARMVEIARPRGVYVIEDAAQAHGSLEFGRPVGSMGDLAVFSFYATKNMTTGEGGMITGTNARLLERCRLIVNQGAPERYRHTVIGFNHRMTSIAAAIGIVQLGHLTKWNERRRANAHRLTESLAGHPWITPPFEREGCFHVYHQYVVRASRRDALQGFLTERGIGTAIHYPRLIPDQPAYQSIGYDGGALPVARRLAETVLALPVHPALSDADLDAIIAAVAAFGAGQA
jgi:dTDP-4-amino-4,6-dideoxygalactose transaminase